MTTVPEKGLVALVSVMEMGAGVPFAPLAGVVMEATPEAGVVPPPGRLPTAVTAYVVSGVSPVTGQSLGLAHVTVMGVPPPTGTSLTV